MKRCGREYGQFRKFDDEDKLIPKDSPDAETLDLMQDLWDALLGEPSENISSLSRDCADAAMKLMAIADEASVGIGFIHHQRGKLPYAELVFFEHEYLFDHFSPRKRLRCARASALQRLHRGSLG